MGAKASFSSEWHLRVFVCMSRLAEVIRLIISHTYHFEATHTYHMYQAQLKLNKGSSHVDWPNPSEPIMEIYANVTDLAGLVFSVTRSSIGHPITRSPIQRPDDPSTRSHDHTIVQRLERCIDGHLLPGSCRSHSGISTYQEPIVGGREYYSCAFSGLTWGNGALSFSGGTSGCST